MMVARSSIYFIVSVKLNCEQMAARPRPQALDSAHLRNQSTILIARARLVLRYPSANCSSRKGAGKQYNVSFTSVA